MTKCEYCDTEKGELRLSDTADIWVCKECHELNPHHSNWEYLKQKPYEEYHKINMQMSMSREAIEHIIELLDYDENGANWDLENNSIDDIEVLREKLQEELEK